MSIASVLKNRFVSKDPFFLIFFVTARCNARCKMCFNWDNVVAWRQRPDLTIEEIEKITLHIKSLQQLTLSGGEPFIRCDLDEICRLFSVNSKARFITIPTNGVLTKQIREILPRILEKCPETHVRLGLSMPEMGRELEELYGVKDSFERHQETFQVVKAIKKKYSNLNVDIGIVANKYNFENVKKIVDYVSENMEGCNPIVSMVRGKPQFKDAKDIPVGELGKIYEYIKKKIPKINNRPFGDFMNLMRDMVHENTITMVQEKRMVLPCRSGDKMLVIYDNGDVFPCEILDQKLGNLKDHNYNIHEIMQLESTKKAVDDIIRKKCYCTWECAQNNNIVFSPKANLELAKRYVLYKAGFYGKKGTPPPLTHELPQES